MIRKISVLLIAGTLCSLNLLGQDASNRKDKAINTRQATPVKIIETIPGAWRIEKSFINNKDVSGKDSIETKKILEFGREARYVVRSGTNVIDSGAYRVNENQQLVYLESVLTKEVEEWNVKFINDTMTLQSKSPASNNRKYIYTRIAEANKQ